MKKDINSLLSEIIDSSGASVIISDPATLQDLQRKGLKLDQHAQVSPQEYINRLFKTKKKSAIVTLDDIPTFPDVPIPTINFLYKEIMECVLFGLHGAAITLSAILVEYALKQAIVRKKYGNEYGTKEWDQIENIEFGMSIKEAKRLGILDGREEEKFRDFKNQIRNPYLHYNIKKITKGVRADKVVKLNTKTQKKETVQLDAKKDPIIWPYAKKFIDKKRLKNVLDFACKAVQLLLIRKK